MKQPFDQLQDPTTYNKLKQQESLDMRKKDIINKISEMEDLMLSTKQMNLTIVDIMDLVERTISSCGGDPKVTFRDVSYDFIRVQTRVPLTANLFPFLPEGDNNPKFHKVVTRVLMGLGQVHGIRWFPDEDRGAYLTVSLKR